MAANFKMRETRRTHVVKGATPGPNTCLPGTLGLRSRARHSSRQDYNQHWCHAQHEGVIYWQNLQQPGCFTISGSGIGASWSWFMDFC